MSTKNSIYELLLSRKRPLTVNEIVSAVGAGRSYVSRTLAKMVAAHQLTAQKRGRNVYYGIAYTVQDQNYALAGLDEFAVLTAILNDKEFARQLSEQALTIFGYAFTEMLQNTISHSRSAGAWVLVKTENNNLYFSLHDSGIGMFHSIRQKLQLPDELAAVRELLRGQTNLGKGFFFASSIADKFQISSAGHTLILDNANGGLSVTRNAENLAGTLIEFTIRADTTKSIEELFRRFA